MIAGGCDFWNITGGMDQDIFHNIDTDRYSEKLKTMYVVVYFYTYSKGGLFSNVIMGLIISPNNRIKSLYSKFIMHEKNG